MLMRYSHIFNPVTANEDYYMALSKMNIGFLRDFTGVLLILHFVFTYYLGLAVLPLPKFV
jgi:hypothetical protein